MNQSNQRKEFQSFKLCPIKVFETFQMSIPSFLQELSADEKSLSFPASIADKIWIACNEHKDMLLQVTCLDANPLTLKIEDIFQQTCLQMRRITPGFQLFGHGTKMVSKITVACMNYKSHTINNDNYNILFMFSICKKSFSANFSAPLIYQNEWTRLFLLMIDTLQQIDCETE